MKAPFSYRLKNVSLIGILSGEATLVILPTFSIEFNS